MGSEPSGAVGPAVRAMLSTLPIVPAKRCRFHPLSGNLRGLRWRGTVPYHRLLPGVPPQFAWMATCDPPGRGRGSRRARRPAGRREAERGAQEGSPPAGAAGPALGVRPASRESSTNDLRTSGAVGHGRIRPRNRQGVPMRTPAPKTCAPAGRRKLLCAKVLRLAVSGGRGRRAHSDGAGSDPAVRGPAAGSGPGAFAHPRPRPLGSLPDKQSLAGRRFGRRFEAADHPFADRLAVGRADMAEQVSGTTSFRLAVGLPARNQCLGWFDRPRKFNNVYK